MLTSLLTFTAACGTEAEEASAPTGPVVEESSASRVVIGQTIDFAGYNFLPPEQGLNKVHFLGTYTTDDGRQEPVDVTFTTIYDGFEDDENPEGRRILRLNRFGPFANPFDSQDRPGIFKGQVSVMTTELDGELIEEGEPGDFQMEVGPSIVIEELQPLDAECGAPALRGLAGMPYRLRVRPVGIQATRFIYEVANVNGESGVVRFDHTYSAPVGADTLGYPLDEGGVQDEYVLFNPVPDADQFYVSGVRVLAFDKDGNSVETALPFTVHRPIEVNYSGKLHLAERYAPQPVSGCIRGDLRSNVKYSETTSETRQQTVSVAFSRDFVSRAGVSNSQSWKEGISEGERISQSVGGAERESETSSESYGVSYNNSERNDVGYSTEDGESWSSSYSEGENNSTYRDYMAGVYGSAGVKGTVGVKGEFGVPGMGQVTGNTSTTLGVKVGGRFNGTNGERVGTSTDRGWGMSGDRSETSRFGSTTTDSRSQNLSGTYALSADRNRSFNDTMTREQTRTWSFSEGLRQTETVAEGSSEREGQTWLESSTDEVSQNYSGFIPNDQVGVFYRQTTRWVRTATVKGYDLCGLATDLGEMQFSEWTWAPELSIGSDCTAEPPPSTLPPAACFIPPCDVR
ncbi:MAG: hypothetical protein ACE366_29425 [Bradymonadia bacterium]